MDNIQPNNDGITVLFFFFILIGLFICSCCGDKPNYKNAEW